MALQRLSDLSFIIMPCMTGGSIHGVFRRLAQASNAVDCRMADEPESRGVDVTQCCAKSTDAWQSGRVKSLTMGSDWVRRNYCGTGSFKP